MEHDPNQQIDASVRRGIGCAVQAQAMVTAASALLVAVVSLILTGLLEGIAEQVSEQEMQVGQLALWCLDNRFLIAIGPALVALVLAVLAMRMKSGRMLLLALALILLVGQVAVLLAGFVTLMAPLYSVQEL